MDIVEGMCRDRMFQLPVSVFNVYTCSMCYQFLFREPALTPQRTKPWMLQPSEAGRQKFPANFSVIADVNDATSTNSVCSTLSHTDCSQWTDCCKAAIDCCQRQLATPLRNLTSLTSDAFCPRTWDGFGCFEDALPSTRNYLSCPSYIEHGSPRG